MNGITPARWLGQREQVLTNLNNIPDLAERGKAITDLIDQLWNTVLPDLGRLRRAVVRQMAVGGMTDTQIADQIGVNRQRVSQLRKR